MNTYFVCRILKFLKPLEYNHVRECTCIVYGCYQNKKLNDTVQNDYIPYIQCKVEKNKSPDKYKLSKSCNCKFNNCKIRK